MSEEDVDKRQELLEEAVRVFSSKGYRATSVQELADRFGLRKSTFYHYFHNKQDLLVAIYERVMAENLAAAKRITDDKQSVVESMRQMLSDRVMYTCDHHEILQIFHEEEAEISPRLMTKVLKSRRAYQRVMTDLLEQGLAEDAFEFTTTPMVAANCLLGACNWSYKWFNPDGAMTAKELATEMSDLLMKSVLPSG